MNWVSTEFSDLLLGAQVDELCLFYTYSRWDGSGGLLPRWLYDRYAMKTKNTSNTFVLHLRVAMFKVEESHKYDQKMLIVP
jgi:hypothetical protein